jgi:DNA-binding FrmR family transcriptional regulator
MAYRPKDTRERIIHRLKIARGHLDKVIQMMEDDTYCIDVMKLSQNLLSKADTYVKPVAESGISGLVQAMVRKAR